MAFNVLPASIFVPPVASPKFKSQAHSFNKFTFLLNSFPQLLSANVSKNSSSGLFLSLCHDELSCSPPSISSQFHILPPFISATFTLQLSRCTWHTPVSRSSPEIPFSCNILLLSIHIANFCVFSDLCSIVTFYRILSDLKNYSSHLLFQAIFSLLYFYPWQHSRSFTIYISLLLFLIYRLFPLPTRM